MLRGTLVFIVSVGALASIALCASYGWDQAPELKDKITQAFVYGFVALAALFLHVLAVRIWVAGWRKSAAFVGFVGVLAFLMTAFTSLGGLASRSDRIIAERQTALDDKADVKRQIDELVAERSGMKFTRATQATVDAAKMLADTAKQTKDRECGNGDARQRGRFCREKEDAEAEALRKLAQAQADKAATERFDAVEAQIRALRANRTESTVGAADPMKALLGKILGTWADVFTNWQKAAFALVYDLVLLAFMIGIEIMEHAAPKARRDEGSGEAKRPEQPAIEAPKPIVIEATPVPEPPPVPARMPPLPRPKLATARKEPPAAPIPRIMTAALDPSKGARVRIDEAFGRYCADSKAEGREPVAADVFIDAMTRFCKSAQIRTKVVDGALYLMDVQLVQSAPSAATK